MDTSNSNNIGINLYTDASGMDPGIAQAEQKLDELNAAAASSAEKVSSQMRASEDEVMKYWTGMSVAQDNAKAKAWALANGYKDAGGVMVKSVEEVAGKVHTNSLAMRESLVLVREAARGNFTRMAGSASILAQSLGGLGFLMNPIVLGVAGITAAVGAAGFAAYKFAEYEDEATDAVKANTEASKENIDASLKLEEQVAGVYAKLQLQNQGITGLSDADNKRIVGLQQEIKTMNANLADGVKILWDGTYVQDKLYADQKALNRLLADANALQAGNNKLKEGKESDKNQKNTAKLLSDAQRFDDQMLEVDKDSFTKRIDEWVKYENIIQAQIKNGNAGALEAEKRHAAALDALTTAEYNKRTAANEAAASKKTKLELQHQTAAINSENAYFARLQAMADAADQFSGNKKNLQYNKELIALKARHKKTMDEVKNDHAASLAEEEKYQIALGNLKQIYAIQRFTVDTSITSMIAAFNQNDHVVQIQATLGYFEQLSSIGASHHRAMFEINKRASEASAIINTYEAATEALKLGPIEGPIMEIAITALGMAKVDAIESTQFGGGAANSGGGGIPSLATSPGVPVAPVASSMQASPAVPTAVTPAPQATQQLNYTIIGAKDNPDKAVISFNAAVAMMAAINQAGARGHKINATVIAA